MWHGIKIIPLETFSEYEYDDIIFVPNNTCFVGENDGQSWTWMNMCAKQIGTEGVQMNICTMKPL